MPKEKKTNINVLTHSLIEQCVRMFCKRRIHQNVIDFDAKYLKEEIMKTVLEEVSKFPKA